MIKGLWIINTKANLKRAHDILVRMAEWDGGELPSSMKRDAFACARDLKILHEQKIR